METKIINGIEYIVYESGMILNDETKSYYFAEDLDYEGDVKCLHFYAIKDVIVRGNQDVGGNQYIRGNQDVGGYQDVRGNQYIRGNQDVDGYQYIRGNQYVGGYQDVRSNQYIRGNQYVGGYQDVRSNQYVGGYQDVRSNQYIRGNQDVRYIYLHLYCRYSIRLDLESDEIKIGCVGKSSKEWQIFFAEKQTIEMQSDDRNYKKLSAALNAAIAMREVLIVMNDKSENMETPKTKTIIEDPLNRRQIERPLKLGIHDISCARYFKIEGYGKYKLKLDRFDSSRYVFYNLTDDAIECIGYAKPDRNKVIFSVTKHGLLWISSIKLSDITIFGNKLPSE